MNKTKVLLCPVCGKLAIGAYLMLDERFTIAECVCGVTWSDPRINHMKVSTWISAGFKLRFGTNL